MADSAARGRVKPDEAPVGAALERTFLLSDRDFQRICTLIHERAGISLGPHKRDMVYSRLVRRLRAHSFTRFVDYLDALESRDDADEWQAFVNALTTNLTSFFREAYHFEALKTQLLESPRASRQSPLLIWCSAASTGEEVWSLAITACEAFDTDTPPVRIIATDIDTQVLETAERGVYAVDRIAALSDARRQAFFQRGSGPNSGQCRVKAPLRELVEFAPANLLDPSFPVPNGLTAIFCRNVMIYFDKPTQYRVLQRLRPMLAPGGRLYAGHSESFNHAGDLFTACGRTIYEPVRAR